MDYWVTPEATNHLIQNLGCGSREEAIGRLRIDCGVMLEPRYFGPLLPSNTSV
jgi:hypothetical protein